MITYRRPSYTLHDDAKATVKSEPLFHSAGLKRSDTNEWFKRSKQLLTLISVRLFISVRGNELRKGHPAGNGCTHCT